MNTGDNLGRLSGSWFHLDGSPCPIFLASTPTPEGVPNLIGGRPSTAKNWWCTEHQQYLTWAPQDIEEQIANATSDPDLTPESAAAITAMMQEAYRRLAPPPWETPQAVGIFICPVCEAVIEGDRPCPRRGLKQHAQAADE